MNEPPKKLLLEITAIVASFSIACVTGGGFIPSVFQAITGDFAKGIFSDYLKKFHPERIGKWFTINHPDNLNHHLQRLLSNAIVRALDHVKILYDEQSVETQEQTRQATNFLDRLAKAVPQYLDPTTQIVTDKQLDTYLYQTPEESLPLLFKSLNLFPEHEDLSKPFIDFLSTTLITQVQLCFAEELKLPENHEAWVAFQRRLAEESRQQLHELLDGQTRIQQQIQDLAISSPPLTQEELGVLRDLNEQFKKPHFFEIKIADELDASIIRLRNQMAQITLLVTQTHENVLKLQKKADIAHRKLTNIERTLKMDWWSRKLVIAYIVTGVSLLLFSGYTYYIYTLPFSLTLQIHGPQGRNDLLLRNRGSVQLVLGQKVEQADINQNGESYFKELPAHYKYELVVARLTNTEGEPIQLVDSLIRLTPDSILYLSAKILGLDLLQGYVRDMQTHEPIQNASLQIQSLQTTTQEDGFFRLLIPPSQQAKFQDIRIMKKGYLPYIDYNVPMQSRQPIDVLLTPLN